MKQPTNTYISQGQQAASLTNSEVNNNLVNQSRELKIDQGECLFKGTLSRYFSISFKSQVSPLQLNSKNNGLALLLKTVLS